MARLLVEKGYREVWPLLGGFDAWEALDYPLEPILASASPLPLIAAVKSSA
ncbi:MAG: hypothetical protein LAP13_06610 [Acidobacteriia bacterium]|nr:hypothetical protein [Terriglobia bacterium]